MTRRLARFLVLTISVAAASTVVFAHMKATKVEPLADAVLTAPPARIQVWFTETPDPALSKLEVVGPDGAIKLAPVQVTEEKSIGASVDGRLVNGRYTARWQSAGTDGHVQKGEFAFSVKSTH